MQEKQKVVSAIADPIPEEVRKHIEATASAMIGHSNLRQDDFQDICQEISMAVVKAASNHNPEICSYYTYAQAVIKNTRNRIFRYRMRHELDVPMLSLDKKIKSDDDGDLTVFDEYCNHLSESEERRKETLAEVRETVSRFTGVPQKICILIMQGYTHHEIRKMLQLPETTYFRHFAKIRETFKKNPFFFKNSGSK